MSAGSQALFQLVSIFLNLFGFIFLTRFLLQLVKADINNPISQSIIKLTDPFTQPLRKIMPNSSWDFASFILWIAVEVLSIILIWKLLTSEPLPSPAVVIVWSAIKTLASLIDYFFWVIIIGVIMSWVAQGNYNPLHAIVHQLSEPLMAPLRKVLPPMGGLDFSAMIVLVVLQIVGMTLIIGSLANATNMHRYLL